MPDWVGPATYFLGLAIILTTLGVGYQVLLSGTPVVTISSLPKITVTKPHDSPKTAASLSSGYPTLKYQRPSNNIAARGHQASKAFAKEPLQETTKHASREPIVVTEFRSDVSR
jgi:hypothetical protein